MALEPTYVLSVDVEDYYQVEAFAANVSRSDWDRWPSRVLENTRRTLDLCDAHAAKATFFILGWVARKSPVLVREIRERGHEVACHSFWHRPVYSLSPEEFRTDLREARDTIQDAAGVAVTGYRAPSWSITAKSMWALDILAEEGFRYDSSIFPIRHDLYGYAGGKRTPYLHRAPGGEELIEFPPATLQLFGTNLPCAGGGYLRIFPFWYMRWALSRIGREEGQLPVVYFHPWEIDPDQPRIDGPRKSRFRHYTNLRSMAGRLERLMKAHRFQPFQSVLESGFQAGI
jgi:polysaccharide deacetylase family protein (PEP-CTERM system associated)